VGRSDNDIYLSEEGPNYFEALVSPQKELKQAIKDLAEREWEK